MSIAPRLVIGTAGHIDHGKSRLVLALTGTDPDRLPEEKARGMTIDLGFAHTTVDGCDLYFVDVPGHERFIRNMVAGATGVDVALLVVAADDSIMPQTREHAEVLRLLGLRSAILVLTKVDLVEEDWAAAVEDEARGLLSSVGVAPIACVRTSAQTGAGLDELRRVLVSLARDRFGETQIGGVAKADQSGKEKRPETQSDEEFAASGAGVGAPSSDWFRMPIDRVFSVPGRGTVVTGTVMHGEIERDRELDLWPSGRRVRVRDLQTHSHALQRAAGRMRLALNLTGVALDDVRRGDELADAGHLEPSRCLDVRLDAFRPPGAALRATYRVRLHLATSEVLARLRLIAALEPNAPHEGFAQLITAEPIVAELGQRFLLRDEAATQTLGGGVVARPVALPWSAGRKPHEAELQILLVGSPRQRLEEVVRAYEWSPCGSAALAARAGLSGASEAQKLIQTLGVENRVVGLATGQREAGPLDRTYIHATRINEASAVLVEKLRQHLMANPRLVGLPKSEWAGWMPRACPAKLRDALADWLIQKGRVVAAGAHLVPPGHAAAMSADDEQLYQSIVAEFREAAFSPPEIAALRSAERADPKRVRQLIDRGVSSGQLVRIADGFWLHARRWQELVVRLDAALQASGPLSVADLRTLLGTTRKYMVPLAEHLDAVGLTRREGDVRKRGPKFEAIVAALRAAHNHIV